MKVYAYSEARQKLSTVLDLARSEDVMIKKGLVRYLLLFIKRNHTLHLTLRGLKRPQQNKIFLMR